VQEYKIPLVISNGSYVAKYFSQAIIEDELDSISKAISKSELEEENLEVRLNKSTREIITRYQVDEGEKNEMIIRLPPSYPLAEVEIDGKSRVGVTAERWNKWLLTCKIACKV
jgi:E3 ubiquitin-protein ligase listerin